MHPIPCYIIEQRGSLVGIFIDARYGLQKGLVSCFKQSNTIPLLNIVVICLIRVHLFITARVARELNVCVVSAGNNVFN